MEPVKFQQKGDKSRHYYLDDTRSLNKLDERELLSAAMSSYYLLYR